MTEPPLPATPPDQPQPPGAPETQAVLESPGTPKSQAAPESQAAPDQPHAGRRARGRREPREERRFVSSIKTGAFVLLLAAILFVAILLSLCTGQYNMTMADSAHILFGTLLGWEQDWTKIAQNVVFALRLPRACAAALVGASLAISGAVYQGIFRNPLVSPDLLGVSSGACVGAAVAILAGLTAFQIQMSAFAFGILTVAVTLLIPRLLRSESNIMLVLSGVIVGGLMGSVMGFIKYIADPETQLAEITYWQMGSFAYVKPNNITSVLPTMAVGFVLLYVMAWWIDILSLGDDEAKSLGVRVQLVRNLSIAGATLLTSSAICICGTVGWIGLVIPHFARMFVGPNNTRLLPSAALMGAIFMVTVDLVARTLTTVELPLSVLTGFIGAPFYVFLLYKTKGKGQLR